MTSSCHDAKHIQHLSVSMSSLPGSGFILRGNTFGTSEAVASLSGKPTLLSTVAVLALEVDDLHYTATSTILPFTHFSG